MTAVTQLIERVTPSQFFAFPGVSFSGLHPTDSFKRVLWALGFFFVSFLIPLIIFVVLIANF